MKTIITAMVLVVGMSASGWAAAAGDAAAGQKVFNKVCKMCHATGMMGAPKLGSSKDWDPRVKQGEDTLVQHAIHGYKKMPAKGHCRTCSDQEIANAVAYMLSKLK